MTIKNQLVSCILIVLLGLIAGCAKVGTGPVFTWNYATSNTADSAFSPASTPPGDEILAYGTLQVIRIQTPGTMTVGSHSLSTESSGSFIFIYYAGTSLYSQSGTLTITANNGTSMSGSFSTTFTDGTGMNGSFSDIPIR